MQNRSRLLVLNIGERIRFYDVATIVRTLLLAVFFCNDRILPARCLRHIQSVFNLIVDNDPYGHPFFVFFVFFVFCFLFFLLFLQT